MFQSSIKQNIPSSPPLLFFDKAPDWGGCYPVEMTKTRARPPIKAWIKLNKRTQVALAEELNWQESKVSRIVGGHTPPDTDDLEMLAEALHVKAYELMMSPQEAMALRNLRASAETIVSESRTSYTPEPSLDPFTHNKDDT